MKLQSAQMTSGELENLLSNSKNKNKIILFQEIGTLDITCSRCGAHSNHSNEINHRSCCSYIGGSGC